MHHYSILLGQQILVRHRITSIVQNSTHRNLAPTAPQSNLPPSGPQNDEEMDTPLAPTDFVPAIDDIRESNEFIKALKNASINSNTEVHDPLLINRISRPLTTPPTFTELEQLSIKLFLATSPGSDKIYTDVCKVIQDAFPTHGKLLSLYQVKQRLAKSTGITEMKRDMCIKGCVGYTGPFHDIDICPTCNEERYFPAEGRSQKLRPRLQFTTIPLATQLQAFYTTEEEARKMLYCHDYTTDLLEKLNNPEFDHQSQKFTDFFDGSAWLEVAQSGTVNLKKRHNPHPITRWSTTLPKQGFLLLLLHLDCSKSVPIKSI